MRLIRSCSHGTLALVLALTLGACSRSDETPVAEVEEVDVAAAPPVVVFETEAVNSILAGIDTAREDIARGDAIAADADLDAPQKLLGNFLSDSGVAVEVLDQPDALGGLADEVLPVASTYLAVSEARTLLQSERTLDLAAADAALAKAQHQATMFAPAD